MTQKANTSKYRMSFGTGGLFLNESVAIARLYQELGDWTAVKKAAGAKGVIPFRKQSSVIKNVDVDATEVARELEALIFDGVIKDRKIRHDGAAHDYSFARKLDDRLQGRDYELSINVVTPFHEHSGNAEALRMGSMSNDELVILLKTDDRFARDLVMYKQTEKYVRQTRATAPQASIERIISEKGQQNANRYRDLSTRARTLVAEAQLFVRGEELDLRGEDPQARVRRAFQMLVDKVYTNLPMLRGATYAETDRHRHRR